MATVLVVDDNEKIRAVVARMLTDAGYDVSQASTGKEALEAVQRTRFHLVITDVYMPDMDGIEFISRTLQDTNHPRLVVMSGGGYANTGTVAEIAKSLGVKWILAKPFDKAQLLQAVQDALDPLA